MTGSTTPKEPQQSETPTPRTEAVKFSALGINRAHLQDVVQLDFARTLERECAELRERLAAFGAIDKLTTQEQKGLLAVGQELIALRARAESAESALSIALKDRQKRRRRVVEHVCGLQGYNPMIDPLCPACKLLSKHGNETAARKGGA